MLALSIESGDALMKLREPDYSTRRSFFALGASATAGLSAVLGAHKHVPIGLELYSVRDQVKQNVNNAVRQVAKMGYEVVEIYSIYLDYSIEQATELRKVMDEVKIRCVSTHNNSKALEPENLAHTIELNKILEANKSSSRALDALALSKAGRKSPRN